MGLCLPFNGEVLYRIELILRMLYTDFAEHRHVCRRAFVVFEATNGLPSL